MNRLSKLRKEMSRKNLECLLITNAENRRYLTGFTGSAGVAIVSQKAQYFITDARYVKQAELEAKDFAFQQNKGSIFEEIEKIIRKENISSLAFEENLSYGEYLSLQEQLATHCSLESYSGVIESLREIKEESEQNCIRQACEIADRAFTHILNYVKPGVSEKQVANELDFFMRTLGASGTSFETIVASGRRSAMPHGVASEKIIANNELVTIDFGCFYQGYASDMTRTFAVGEIDDRLKEIYEIVRQAQERVTKNVKAGLSVANYDKLARHFITEKGYGKYFEHGLGHGIGLEIHEAPVISSQINALLKENQVITNEPGIYLPNLGGVRIEDDLIVTKNGCELLTKSPRELIVL